MSALLARLDRWWFEPAPALRLAVLRVLIVGFGLCWLIGHAPLLLGNLRSDPSRFHPIGVVEILDAPLRGGVGLGVLCVTLISGIAALVGWRHRALAPVYALGLLWVTSYRNSWGMLFHAENLLVLHTLVLALLPASDAWSLDARGDRVAATEPDPRYGWGPKLMATLTALVYVLAGVAKLRNAGVAWVGGDVLLSHVAWDNLRKLELGAGYSPLGVALLAYPAIFGPLAWASMILELGAPIALFGRRLAWIWVTGMWLFHLGVLAIMAILFAYPVSGVAFAPSFAVEVPVQKLAARVRRRNPSSWLARRLPE